MSEKSTYQSNGPNPHGWMDMKNHPVGQDPNAPSSLGSSGIPRGEVEKPTSSPALLSGTNDVIDGGEEIVQRDTQKEGMSENQSRNDKTPDETTVSTDALLTYMQSISRQIEDLHEDFETKIKYDADKAKTIQYQRQEMRKYQEDLYFKILRPVIMELIAMHDDISKLIEDEERFPETEKMSERVIKNIVSFQETIETILYLQGITSYQCEGDVYNSKLQQIREVIKTPEDNMDGKITRWRKGFRYEDKILRREIVSVYKYVEPERQSEK